MTPKQLTAWTELIHREEVRKTINATNTARRASQPDRDYQTWIKKQAEEAK